MSAPRRLALITEPAHPSLQPDDEHLALPLRAAGFEPVPVPWGERLDPRVYCAALLRSPWDYFLHVERFLDWCGSLEVPLLNPAPLVRWNAHKGYLVQLAEAGAARIPPTRLVRRGASAPDTGELARVAGGVGKLVVKPAVSGGAHETFVLDAHAPDAVERVAASIRAADTLVQRYEPRLVENGEWSLVFIAGRFSHAVRKVARAGDFRVQSEFGGAVLAETPPRRMLDDAARCLASLGDVAGAATPLYARVDGFEEEDGALALVELELIEPELFWRVAPEAASRMAEVLADSCVRA